MNNAAVADPLQADVASLRELDDMLLHFRIEKFLFREAELLDEHRFKDWLDLLDEQVAYRMPIQRNRLRRQRTNDMKAQLKFEMAHYDDDRAMLEIRVAQLDSGQNWAEEPRSRSRHFITNVRVAPTDDPAVYEVRSNFIVTRNRGETEEDIWAGERYDEIRASGDSFKIVSRLAILDQNVVLSKNLSIFF
ncbi:MAG TPA: 3-phenylpropionate/cinnamic acid dioxygenase subunit beta [Pararobbsia sp.]|jgi:3-phenylpropionate/cinnamic acid dioxygenase small subunit|nr:3-phenylpropionate/cinnamic acid dioxygenase subunit beta [Pararobbsia sp.]